MLLQHGILYSLSKLLYCLDSRFERFKQGVGGALGFESSMQETAQHLPSDGHFPLSHEAGLFSRPQIFENHRAQDSAQKDEDRLWQTVFRRGRQM